MISFITAILPVTKGFAQNNPVLADFTVFEVNSTVYLNWTIAAGGTCNGIRIFRSTNNLQFTQIGSIDGVCGSVTAETNYTYIDEKPVFNKTNYYGLELGNSGYSHVVSIDVFDFSEIAYQVRPHPVIDRSVIYFSNKSNRLYEFSLYTLTGIKVKQLKSIENNFEIKSNEFQSGYYIFTIGLPGENPSVKGQLMIN